MKSLLILTFVFASMVFIIGNGKLYVTHDSRVAILWQDNVWTVP